MFILDTTNQWKVCTLYQIPIFFFYSHLFNKYLLNDHSKKDYIKSEVIKPVFLGQDEFWTNRYLFTEKRNTLCIFTHILSETPYPFYFHTFISPPLSI